MPAEAQSQFYKLKTRDDDNTENGSKNDEQVLKIFLDNSQVRKFVSKLKGRENYCLLRLNMVLVNHSCAPNAACMGLEKVVDEDIAVELRAIKNIAKGEEITNCYFSDVMMFGSIPSKRKTAIKKILKFDCKCPVRLGQVSGQENP